MKVKSIARSWEQGSFLVVETTKGYFSIVEGVMWGNNTVIKGEYYNFPIKDINESMFCSDLINKKLLNGLIEAGYKL